MSITTRSGDYGFSGTCRDLDITQGFIKDEGVPETDFSGHISLAHDALRKAYRVDAELTNSSILGFEGRTMTGSVVWRDGVGLSVRRCRVERPGFVLTARGSISPAGEGDLILAVDGDSLDYVMDFVTLPRIGGRARLSGRLLGPMDRFQVNLNGTWRDLTYLNVRIDSCQVKADARQVPSPQVTATVDIQGGEIEIVGRRFATPHVLLEADTSMVVVRDFSFSRADTFFTSDFTIDPGLDVTPIRVEHVAIETPGDVWRNIAPTDILVRGSVAEIDSVELTANGHAIGLAGVWHLEGGASDLVTWGRSIDLSLLKGLVDVPFALRGNARYDARLTGAIDNPAVDAVIEIGRGVIDSLAFDRLFVDGVIDESGYTLGRFELVHAGDTLSATARWEFEDSPFEVARGGFDRELALGRPVSVRARSAGYPVASVMRALHMERRWPGGFDGTLAIDGTLADPYLALLGTLHARAGDRYRLPPIDVNVEYGDERLTVNSLSFDDGRTRADMRGVLPVGFELGSGVIRYPDRRVNLAVEVVSDDLARAAGYVDWLRQSEGRLSGRFRALGVLGNPDLEGTLELEDGTIQIAGMREVYRDARASLTLDNNRIVVESCEASVGKKGKIEGTGTAQLDGFSLADYRIEFDAEDVTWRSVPNVVSTQSGRVVVQGRRNPAGQLVPDLQGNLRVKQAVLTMELGSPDGAVGAAPAGAAFGPMPAVVPRWYCRLDLDAPNNVWVRNPDLNMEIGGRVIAIRDEDGLYFRGDLNVLRGTYSLYNNKFRITDGRIDFSAGTVRPDMHISAYTPHRRPGEREHRIFLDLSWPYDKKEPTIALTYDEPGYSETDLWRMLGGQMVAGDAGLGPGSSFAPGGAAQSIASNYLERILNAQMQNTVIDVESRMSTVDTGGSRQRELSVAIGRYFSEDLYLKYRQGITYTTEREVDVEYRLSRMILLRSEIIRNRTRGLAGQSRRTTDEINFDIKFRFEF